MEDKPQEMASGKLPVPEFSGMVLPPTQNIKIIPFGSPEPNAGGDKFEPKLPEKPPVKLKSSDLRKLKTLFQDEKVAVAAAKEAIRKRDLFCVDLETQYGLIGSEWTVDFSNGVVTITGKK